MKSQQSGFTLVEIAIVLVIIGLLLGGVLKGQELINSAKVKNMAGDFRNVPLFIYGYQDKFKALPGDDSNAVAHLCGGVAGCTTGGNGDGQLDGNWNDGVTGTANSGKTSSETYLFWQHVRLAGLASGTTTTGANYLPVNADGGPIGIQSGVAPPITGLRGSYILCSGGVLGKYAKQLDTTLDNGDTLTGAVMVADLAVGPAPIATANIVDASPYTVCMGL
jgi:prepilin-type N-terminal cleavage/methylation domain-containing protein